MPVISSPKTVDNPVNFVYTLLLFCCVFYIKPMLKFGRFKASLNFYNGKGSKNNMGHDDIMSVVSVSGAYRTKRDEFGGYSYPEVQRKVTPSLMPSAKPEPPAIPLRQVKSTSDLIKAKNLPPNLQQENSGVSQDPRGAQQIDIRYKPQENVIEKKLDAQRIVEKQRLGERKKIEKQRLEEEKKLEKQRQEELKKQQKLAAQEQAKQEKLRKEREKKEAQQVKKDKKKKRAAPQRPLGNPLAQAGPSPNATTSNNPIPQGPKQYTTNTLESSISKSSGPPPYNDVPKTEGESKSGNVIYSKPVDTGSWDMISQHRQQISSRLMNTAPTRPAKQTVMDLNYKMDGSENRDNSEA